MGGLSFIYWLYRENSKNTYYKQQSEYRLDGGTRFVLFTGGMLSLISLSPTDKHRAVSCSDLLMLCTCQ